METLVEIDANPAAATTREAPPPALQKAISRLGPLPTLPEAAASALAVANDRNSRLSEFAKVIQFGLHDLLGQATKLAQDLQLQFLGHPGQLRGAGRVENDLKRAHRERKKVGKCVYACQGRVV